ncbi:MAG TPA: dihydrofolate reductase family protein [Solirubrobacteraceae bacterium]|nr:dihydrofolate reductase family protein [Solirubrobacteraceae bacterium]
MELPVRPLVYANMISTADGRAARDGRSATIGGEADLQRLLDLRERADAVLIGTGTLRAEGYARLMRSPERRARRLSDGRTEDPLAVILSRRFDVPWDAGLFEAAEQPVLIYTSVDAGEPPPVAAPVEVVRLEVPGLTEMLVDLYARGVRHLLSEGGPTMHGALWAAGVVDELYLTIAPLLTGDADEPNIVEGGRLPEAAELELLKVERIGSELFLRYGRPS